MPDVLIRNLSERDKAFVERYAAEHNMSQAEVMREVLSRGIDALRRSQPINREGLRAIAQDLRPLSDPGFEEDVWG